MQEMIDDRRQSSKDKDDLFSNLLAASFSENTSKEGNIPFTDDDLMGEFFILCRFLSQSDVPSKEIPLYFC